MRASPRPSLSPAVRRARWFVLCAGAAAAALTGGALSGQSVVRAAPAAGTPPATKWLLTTLQSADDYSSLTVDPDGGLHASFLYEGSLYLASNTSGVWRTEQIDEPGTGFGITYSSAAVTDGNGAIHIFYDGTEQLRHATNASGAWSVATIDDPGFDVGDDVSAAVDGSGHLHVSYLDRQNGHLRYATDTSGSWVITDLGAGGYLTSITTGPDDVVHIIHSRFVGGSSLVHTTNAPGYWTTETVGGTSGYYAPVKADAAGNLHISYMNGGLYYGTNASGGWTSTLIDGDVGAAANSSLVLDRAGNVHLTYGDYGNGDLHYATNASGEWTTGNVDTAGDKGYWSSLAIDDAGFLHVTYTDRTSSHLRFATTRASATFRSAGGLDGWVRESAQGSGKGKSKNAGADALVVGDDTANRQVRSILSFDTRKLPDDAEILTARLRLSPRSVAGTNPLQSHGKLQVDIRTNAFGAPALQPTDFDATPSLAGAAVVPDSAEAGVHVVRLPSEGLPSISRTSRTQFRLAFETATDADGVADTVTFHSGNARSAAQRPVLEVFYRAR